MSGQTRQTGFPASGAAGWGSDGMPIWRGGGDKAWWHPKALVALDFVNERALRRLTEMTLTSVCALTRASTAYEQDAAGVWQEFAAHEFTRTSGEGAGLYGAFTNRIRNPRGEGETVGTLDAGGALPTNITISGAKNGLAIDYLGQFTVAGLPAMRLRFYGTAIATTGVNIQAEAANYAAAAQGQAWGCDARVALAAGGLNGAQVRMFMNGNTSGSTYVEVVATGPNITPLATPTYVSSKGVVASATVGVVVPFLSVRVEAGFTYDFTLDFIAPKLVQIAAIEGAELIVNGGFDSAAGWALLSGYTISDGLLNALNPASFSSAYRTISTLGIGDVLKVSFKVSKYVSGTFRPFVSGPGQAAGQNVSANGSYTDYLLANNLHTLAGVQATSGDLNASIDGFSLRPVTAGYLPRFPILPPAGAPTNAMRARDVALVPSFDASLASGLLHMTVSRTGDKVRRILFELSDNSADNVIQACLSSNDRPVLQIVRNGISEALCELPYPVAAGQVRLAFGWGAGGGYIVDQAGHSVSFGAITLPAGLSQLQIGGGLTGQNVNDRLGQMQICGPLALAEASAWTAAA